MSHQPARPLMGIGLITAAVMLFAIGDVASKHLTMLYAVPLVMALRYGINLGLIVALFGPRQGRAMLRVNRPWLVFGHIPDAMSLIGMAMIALAGAGVALHAHFLRRASAPKIPAPME
jgi:drug/metabolite transporter (DMT)-like permease